jgi:hypothetical protein
MSTIDEMVNAQGQVYGMSDGYTHLCPPLVLESALNTDELFYRLTEWLQRGHEWNSFVAWFNDRHKLGLGEQGFCSSLSEFLTSQGIK